MANSLAQEVLDDEEYKELNKQAAHISGHSGQFDDDYSYKSLDGWMLGYILNILVWLLGVWVLPRSRRENVRYKRSGSNLASVVRWVLIMLVFSLYIFATTRFF